ncbi:hypothetical protein U1707_18750 [Sphingomonas sp. PB2P12]|uniref:hypothetical protein n=1 Tax=Sphingomonas sandaracina TaxID=3096157 RepID=UPI002FC686A4
MSWFRRATSGSSNARVEAIRARRKAQGHDLTTLQEGIIQSIADWEPSIEATSQRTLKLISVAISETGRWEDEEEWRISTWFTSSIVEGVLSERPWFTVAVACDGQTLSCGSPSLERAYGFMRLYQKLIVDQFYSVGPPWSDQSPFKPREE